ncbi:hypothetical protein KY289_029447 [Solanum tuberosum]|nr:hypothetical protein KY289_029447 [Solanum tuberosum]
MATENAPDTVHRVKVGPSEAKCCELARQDDTHREKLKHTCLPNIMKPINPEDVHQTKNVPKENQEGTDDTDREKLKDTCTTNIIKPVNSEDVQPTTNVPKENQEGTGSHELKRSSVNHSLVSENHNNSTESHGHLCQPKRKEIPINDDDELVVLIPIGDVPQSQVQKKDSLHLGLMRTKRTLCAKRKRGSDSRKNESASDCDAERKSESSIKNEKGNLEEHKESTLQQIFGMKLRKKKKKTTNIEESGDKDSERARTSKDHGAELIGAKINVWWSLEQAQECGPQNSNGTSKDHRIFVFKVLYILSLFVADRPILWFYEGVISSFDSETNKHKVVYADGEVEKLRLHKERWKMLEDNSSQKDSKRTCTIKDYGKELVGARIKVWWPLDEKFYEGVVSSFDPVERKHKVLYDDGEAEKLRLHKERWEMLEDNSTQKDHGLDFQGHAVSSAM